MSDEQYRRKLQKEIYEYSEVERDAARNADLVPQGSWIYRLMKWVERVCREEREDRRDELREIYEEERLAKRADNQQH